ncbi:hypothetical protein FNF27_00421 [Cafeteria roenbergensis]|uniref:Uncharacterized protein n=1 Tax=Cafeteria roenbergensis TaxID=33653 RepID=A0A5A8EIQ4_CAFRO|nr:hypothetical protein FNF27_00421 [Cafeteria roenbergensis]
MAAASGSGTRTRFQLELVWGGERMTVEQVGLSNIFRHRRSGRYFKITPSWEEALATVAELQGSRRGPGAAALPTGEREVQTSIVHLAGKARYLVELPPHAEAVESAFGPESNLHDPLLLQVC